MIEKALFAPKEASGTYNVGHRRADLPRGSGAQHRGRVLRAPAPVSDISYRPEKHDCVTTTERGQGAGPTWATTVYTPVKMLEDYKAEMETDRFADFFTERYEGR